MSRRCIFDSPETPNKLRKVLNVKDTATLEWTVDLANPLEWKSKRFSTQNKQQLFVFYFFPPNQRNVRVLVSASLNSGEDKHLIRYRVSLLDSTGQKYHTQEYDSIGMSTPENRAEVYISSRKFDQFLTKNNNICKVFVEVDVLEEKSSSPVDKTDVSVDFGKLLETGKMSDMILSAGGKDFAVHKNILAARSPVFGALFEHSETQEMQQNRISIEDMSSDVCCEMLKHIYTGSFPSNNMSEYAFDLFVAADKYQLTQLKLVCEKALNTLLDVNTVCTVLQQADGCNAKKLKMRCEHFIIRNCAQVMKTEGWKEIATKNNLLVELFQEAAQAFTAFLNNRQITS